MADRTLTAVDEHVALSEARQRERRALARHRLRRAAAAFAPILAWGVLAHLADHRLLPGPVEVIRWLVDDIAAGTIWFHGRLTLLHGAIGLLLAIVFGITFGVLIARSRYAEATFEPLLAALYPVPKLSLYPLLIVILGFGAPSKIAMVFMECTYPIIYNTYAGVQSIEKQYFWVGRNFGAKRPQMFGIILRGALPSIMASLRMAVPIMLVIIIVTELIGESRGLGFLIRQAGTNFQPARALGVIFLLAVLGYVLDRIVVGMNRKFVFWARGVDL